MLKAWFAALILASFPAAASDGTSGDIDNVELVSSVMWQPLASGANFIYPPGIPGVMHASDSDRTFRIEQYFSMQVSNSMLMPHVLGTWPHDAAHDLVWNATQHTWSNQFVTISRPVCDTDGGDYGYRCITDLRFGAGVPTGTIGISVGMVVNGIEFTHPNAIFWVIVPEETVKAPHPPAPVQHHFPESRPRDNTDLSETRKQVVRITLDGNFSLGSGFLTRTIEPLAKLFKPQVMQAAALISDPKIFVVTAAHLFPVGYTYGSMMDPLADGVADAESQPFRLGYVYDLDVNGHLLPGAALLLARNAESDIALLQVRKSVLGALADALGVASANDVKGLDFATAVDADPTHDEAKVVLGYPAVREGELVQRVGKLAKNEYPTDDTSNFGPLWKLKLEAMDPSDTDLAEPGMSGGPIIDAAGKVIGLTIERPNDTNSLIALDLTSINRLNAGYALDEKKCMLRFSPFDRILTLVHKDPACDYGHFGSPRPFTELEGDWTVQEILGFADDQPSLPPQTGSGQVPLFLPNGDHEPTNGHTIINGHAIINGHVIINGHTTIKSSVLIVNRDNLQDVNDSELRGGYKLNIDSFRSFTPKGVRILSHTGPGAPSAPLGALILGTRESTQDHLFSPVYSIRDFTIWLHRNADQENYNQLLCVHGTCEL